MARKVALACAGRSSAWPAWSPSRRRANVGLSAIPTCSCRRLASTRTLAGSFTVPVADAYWLYTIQYYGEHVNSDRRLDSLPGLLDLVDAV